MHMPGFRRRSVSPGHAPDIEGLPLARETFLLLRGPDRACEGTVWQRWPLFMAPRGPSSRERSAPGRSSLRLTSRHRTSERTGLTRRRSRKSPDQQGGTPACPVAGPLTDTAFLEPLSQSTGPTPSSGAGLAVLPGSRSSAASERHVRRSGCCREASPGAARNLVADQLAVNQGSDDH